MHYFIKEMRQSASLQDTFQCNRIKPFIFFILLHCSCPTSADDYSDYDLALRIPAALSRFSGYPDVAGMGGASAGSTWSSSINPASLAWRKSRHGQKLSLSPQFSAIEFDAGTKLNISALPFTWHLENGTVIQPTLARVTSNKATTRQGLEFDFDLSLAQLQLGYRISDETTFGSGFSYASSDTAFELGGGALSDTEDDTYSFRLGMLHGLSERLHVGIVMDYSYSDSDTSYWIPSSANISSNLRQVIIRPGTSYRYGSTKDNESAIYFDYQFGYFDNDSSKLRVHRLLTGIDHMLARGLYGRAGLSIDHFNNYGMTLGLGIYLWESTTVDIGYQHNSYPELKPELANADSYHVAVSFAF